MGHSGARKPTNEGAPDVKSDGGLHHLTRRYAAAEGWPGLWGMGGPSTSPGSEDGGTGHTTLMGATTYGLMSGFAAKAPDDPGMAAMTAMPKVVFSSTLKTPLSWANTELVDGDAVQAVREMKQARLAAPAHARQPQPVAVAARSGCGRSLPRGRLPRHQRRHRQRTHLRRLSRGRPRTGRDPHLRRATAVARVRAHRASTGRLAPATEGLKRARAGLCLAQDLLHRLALRQLVDELVQVANLLHGRLFDVLHSNATDHTLIDAREGFS